jgi:transposase
VRIRKRRSIQEKLQIVRETLHAQASVAVIARRHGINANQVFARRRQYQRGQLVKGSGSRAQEAVIVPVQVAELPPVQASPRWS